MNLPRRQFLHLAAGAAALPAMSSIARAQAYPTRPITIVRSALRPNQILFSHSLGQDLPPALFVARQLG
jgi:ferredoxin-NADP reductase